MNFKDHIHSTKDAVHTRSEEECYDRGSSTFRQNAEFENPEHCDEDGLAALDDVDRAQFEKTYIDD
jgi:hypothetical protein